MVPPVIRGCHRLRAQISHRPKKRYMQIIIEDGEPKALLAEVEKMGLERRKGSQHRHLYRKERRGKKIVSIYCCREKRAPESDESEACATSCATAQTPEHTQDA